MSKMEIRALNTPIDTSVDMQISGYALVFNQPSRPMPFVEEIRPGALDGVDLSQVQLLYNHDFSNILARADSDTLKLDVDDTGLHFEATLPDTQLGRDTYTNIKNGNLKGLSFGFFVADGGDTWMFDDAGTDYHIITQIQAVNEISLTAIPAYDETSVQVSAATQRSYEAFLKEVNIPVENEEQRAAAAAKSAAAEAQDTEKPAASAGSEADGSEAEAKKRAADSKASEDAKAKDSAASSAADNAEADSAAGSAGSSADNNSSAASQDGQSAADGSDSSASASQASAAAGDDSSAADSVDKKSDGGAKRSAKEAAPAASADAKGEKRSMATKLTANGEEQKRSALHKEFKDYLTSKQITRAAVDGGIGLNDGSVIIPQDILTPEHEVHQFPRLGNLVRTVSVKHSTGKLPVFQTSDDVLTEHTEFDNSAAAATPLIKPVNWDLKTYTSKYVYSRDLIQDSDYDWDSELSSRLGELELNTGDALVMGALTSGITAKSSKDLIADIKTTLNVSLKPIDSSNASIILSQSAYNALDQVKDGMGRPMLQPDPTKTTGSSLLGKSVIVVDDVLFPKAKAGDVNAIIAPLQKAVINFKQSQITGKFMDTYDVWYQILGIYLREDVEQARPDLITFLNSTAEDVAATSSTTTAPTTAQTAAPTTTQTSSSK